MPTPTTYQFEAVSFDQLKTGDRVKLPQTYAGTLTGWWWPILTVDRVDWIRDDHTALMLRLTEPMPGGDQFVLITGRGMVEAGVRRVVDTPTTQPTNHQNSPHTPVQEAPMPATTVANVVDAYPTPGGARVEVTDQGLEVAWPYRTACTGCPHEDGYRTAADATRYARAHAANCWETQPDEQQVNVIGFAETLETVAPHAPMTAQAVRTGLAEILGRPATGREIDTLPLPATGIPRAGYALLLRRI